MPQRGSDSEWRRAEREAFEAGGGGLRVADATAGFLAATAPIVVGLATEHPRAGLVAGLGGLNVALSMAPGRPPQRARWGSATLCMGALATGLASLVHPVVWLSVVVGSVVVGLAALLRVLGREGALVGFVVSAVFVITNGLPGVIDDALPRAAQFLAGGAVALGLMMLAGLADPVPAPSADRSGPGTLRPTATDLAIVRRHGMVVAATVAATTILYRWLDLGFGYWVPLTALAVLQPDAHSSRVKLIQRASGTLVGTLVVALTIAVSASDVVLVAGIAVASFSLFALREVSYHWLVTLLTPTALLMISTADFEGSDIAVQRVVDTAVGLAIALVVIAATARFESRRSP